MSERVQWIEDYEKCGCSSEAARKRDLLGYCATHGNNRRNIFRYVPDRRPKQNEAVVKRINRKRETRHETVMKRIHDPDAVLNTMRDMLLEASPEEIKELAKEAGLNFRDLAQAGRRAAEKALRTKEGV